MPLPPYIFNADDEAATTALGHALADVLPPGTTVALCGTLGAGKTRLAQAIAEGLGIDRHEVVSPTFMLIQEHRGRRTIYHIDAYRLRDDDEFQQLGPDEYFESDGLVLIEWANRVQRSLPRDYIEIQVTVTGVESRRFEIRAIGPRHEDVVRRLAQK
jgi:tRNA threonylcarbamoyladenosine biosynthesis protein TsaE